MSAYVCALARKGARFAWRQMATVPKEQAMSKGLDRKREGKKKPQKSLQEKRAAKKEKKQNRGFQGL